MSLRIKRHVARTDLKTIRSRLIAVIEFKIQNGLAVVVKRKEIALEVAAAQGEARLKPVEFGTVISTSPEPTFTSIDFAGAW